MYNLFNHVQPPVNPLFSCPFLLSWVSLLLPKKTFLLYLTIFPSSLSLMMRLIRTGYGSMGEDLSRGVWAFCQQPHHWIKCLSFLHQLFSWSPVNPSPLHGRIPTESVLCSSSAGGQLLRVQGCNSHAMSRGQWYTKSPPLLLVLTSSVPAFRDIHDIVGRGW